MVWRRGLRGACFPAASRRFRSCASLVLPPLAARSGANVDAFTFSAEDAQDLRGSVSCCAEPVWDLGVELCDLSRLHRDVVVSDDEPQLPGEHVEPLVAFVTAKLRAAAFGRDDHLPCVRTAWLAGERHDDAVARFSGLRRILGSPTSGAPTSSSSGMRCACAIGRRSSRLGLRCPDSRRDSVLFDIPVTAANSVSVTSRCVRTRFRRGPTSVSTSAIASEALTTCEPSTDSRKNGNKRCRL